MRHLAIAAAFGATLVTFALPADRAEAAPGGSYRESCRRVQDVGNRRNPVIAAQCRDRRGEYRDTTLAYRDCRGDIGNNNGRLVCAGGGNGGGGPGYPGPGNGNGGGWGGGGGNQPLPAGSWRRSCEPLRWNGNVLTARCEDGNRGRQESRLNVGSCPAGRVANAYGRLICE